MTKQASLLLKIRDIMHRMAAQLRILLGPQIIHIVVSNVDFKPLIYPYSNMEYTMCPRKRLPSEVKHSNLNA